MIHQRRVSIVSFILVCTASQAVAQEPPSPDLLVTLNEGIYYYLRGKADEDYYNVAIERFTSVLEHQADDTVALLFRALSYGRLGLAGRNERLAYGKTPALLDEVLELRGGAERVDELRRAMVDLEAVPADATTSAARRKTAESQRDHYQDLLNTYEREKDTSNEQLSSKRQEAMASYYALARAERDRYRAMIEDLNRLAQAIEHPQAVVRLLEVVADAKVARSDEEEARGLVREEIRWGGEATGSVDALRDAAAERLDNAAQILQALLSEPLDTSTMVRVKFFLGVIRYRQAVPLRANSEKQGLDNRGPALLGEAERVMTELADDETTDINWRSYAALYLGLIIPFREDATKGTSARNAILDEAERRIDQAAELDALPREESAPKAKSAIPDLVWRQRKEIARRRSAAPAEQPRNDLSLSLFAGARYDTNVVLLGERTDLPRDISRARDFGFTLGWALDYTWDITERLTLGLQGRTSQLWNVDVHEFDQQAYGGSVALQYELSRQTGNNGPLFLALQYDSDYTLLGRDDFLASHAFTPSLRWYWSDRKAQTDLFLAYQIRDYFEPLYDRRFDRDGIYGTVGVAQRFKALEMTSVYERWDIEPWGHAGDKSLEQDDPDYPKRYLTPYLGLNYSWDSTKGDEFDRRADGLTTGTELPLPWGMELDASASYEWENYPKHSLVDLHRRERRDLVQEYGLTLSRTFVLREGDRANRYTPIMDRLLMTIRAHAVWTLDDSNVVDRLGQAIFEYDRAVYGVSVAFTFN